MKKFAILFLVSLVIAIPSLMPSNAGQSEYTCDTCHSHASLYTSHVEGGKYCSECHGGIHTIHKSVDCATCHAENPFTALCHSAPSDAKIPTVPPGKYSVCENCHQNLVEIHNGDCQRCHTEDINEIHEKANVFGGE